MKDRREFLKNMFTAAVFTGVCPHFLKGELIPTINEDGNKISGIFQIDLNKYPELTEEWGSIKLELYNVEGKKKEEVYITRIPNPPNSSIYFSVLNNVCPHEGQKVYPMNPIEHTFTCSGHGSVFNSSGNWISGPAAQGLTSYSNDWKPGQQYLSILFTFTAQESFVDDTKLYIKSNYPNPFKETTTIVYGIAEDSFISYEILDVRNRTILKVDNKFKTADEYREIINLKDYPDGVYYLNLYINNSLAKIQKIIKMG